MENNCVTVDSEKSLANISNEDVEISVDRSIYNSEEENNLIARYGRNDMYLKNQNDMDNQDNENLRKNIKIGGKINDNQNTNELAGKKLTDEEMKSKKILYIIMTSN